MAICLLNSTKMCWQQAIKMKIILTFCFSSWPEFPHPCGFSEVWSPPARQGTANTRTSNLLCKTDDKNDQPKLFCAWCNDLKDPLSRPKASSALLPHRSQHLGLLPSTLADSWTQSRRTRRPPFGFPALVSLPVATFDTF